MWHCLSCGRPLFVPHPRLAQFLLRRYVRLHLFICRHCQRIARREKKRRQVEPTLKFR